MDKLFNSFRKYFIQNPTSAKRKQDNVLDRYSDILFGGNGLVNKNYIAIPNDFTLTLPIHMARIDGKYLFEKSNFSYLPNLHSALISNRKGRQKDKTVVFYNTKEKNSIAEAKSIKDIVGSKHVKLIPDPDLKKIQSAGKNASVVHFVTHQKNKQVFFNGTEMNIDDLCEALPNNLDMAILNLCEGGRVQQKSKYPIMHKSLAHTMMLKKTKCVITHSWDLGQEASKIFSNKFYKSNKNFSIPKELINKKPSEYGGYMIWGQSK